MAGAGRSVLRSMMMPIHLMSCPVATYFMTYSTILRTSDEYVSSIRRIKELTSQLTKALNHNVFAYRYVGVGVHTGT